MDRTTYCLSERNRKRLQEMAAKRRKPPAKQIYITREIYDRLFAFCKKRDAIRPFVDKAITEALDRLEK